MAQKDKTEKLLLDYNDIFSDIVNTLVFNGKEKLRDDSLVATNILSQYKADDGYIHDMERDSAKLWKKGNVELVLIGIENQTKPEKYFPLRALAYDGQSYRSQMLKRDADFRKGIKPIKPHPVLTIVLYFGDKHWNYEKTLKKVLDIPSELDDFVNDYKINVFEIAWLSEDVISKFKSDFGVLARFFVRKRIDPDYVPDDLTEIKHVDEVLKFLAAMTGDHSYSQIETKGVHNMCEVAQRLKREGASEGEDRMSKLILVLSEKGRMEDITKAAKNKKDREKLFKEFNL